MYNRAEAGMCFKRNTNRKIILGGKKKTMVYNAKKAYFKGSKLGMVMRGKFFQVPIPPRP